MGEPKQRLIAPTPSQVNTQSSSTTPIDPPRFHRTYFYPSLQSSRDTPQPIINNWMMPIFSLHTPTHQQIHPSTSLNNHIHKCDWPGCTWSFKRLEHLKRHMITHTGERKYTCHYPGCGKKFGRSDNFAAHYKTHTKTNPRRSRKSANISADISSALDINNPALTNNNLSNGISGLMTIQLPPPPQPAVPSSSLTQDQIDAFHYYCDTASAANSNSRPSISENATTSPDHASLRYRECY
ncbi:5186_t:CDS:2 [Scutellospora calospora]|uniref:5186_t:CDS:1 n=1 Tax=Scutellospora calospora TaxID=85575 RepID=A0ACA9K0Z6_9GLOM|nr:5186_t:CDS:2 [Scutellospora calospora]